jgi:glycosyltransferase involved in cell wall biosynthesis
MSYLWAKLCQSLGAKSSVYLHPWDQSALNRPEWEEFDGEYADVLDGPGFLRAHSVPTSVPVSSVSIEDPGIMPEVRAFQNGDRRRLFRRLAAHPGLKLEPFVGALDLTAYHAWAAALSRHEAILAPSAPIPAYLSGRPYCALVVGGDMQTDCGRGDGFGAAMSLAFAAARFIIVCNPHVLGHCRRLGFTNAVYLPYAINDDIYCPGDGAARSQWQARSGGSTFFLSTARTDRTVKGNSEELWQALADVCRTRPGVRFVSLAWGEGAAALRDRVAADPVLRDRFLILPPVGKKRLIDYYRSCDAVIDQFVYGYYGSTGLEAAAVGKPVVMRIRAEHYAPLYNDDVAPVCNASTPREAAVAVAALADNPDSRARQGQQMREWLVRTHGKQVAGRRLLAILRLTADRCAIPAELDNPLLDQESEAEVRYHNACRRARHAP